MEIVPQTFDQTQDEEIHVYNKKSKKSADKKSGSKKSKVEVVNYRIPSICTVKIKNGADLLLQSRVPVYQLGQESSIPAGMTIIN